MTVTTRDIKTKPIELTESDLRKIMRGKTNPLSALFFSSNSEPNKLLLAFCDRYIRKKHETGAFTINVLVTSRSHCGYCSDNDGNMCISTSKINYYLLLPENYTLNNIPALKKMFDVSTCYCGGNTKTYKIKDIY